MDPGDIERKLRLGEDAATEFKTVARSGFDIDAGDLAKVIAAFANAGGGHVFLGVEDDGTPSGVGSVEQADALMRKASQVCRDRVRPIVGCRITKEEARGVPILLIEVPGFNPERPYLVGGVTYFRDANRTRQADSAELKRLLQSADYHFDEQPVQGAGVEDLDWSLVTEFLRTVYAVDIDPSDRDSRDLGVRYLKNLGCLDEGLTPTVTGILFFGREPQRWLCDAAISAVRFPGIELGMDFADRKEIRGAVQKQFEGALAFLAKHTIMPSRLEGAERKEGGIPAAVLREALLNALSHRDYRMASQVRLFVFDDRVEIANPGELLNRVTMDGLRLGLSQRRNPRVASLLALVHSARRENLGVGVPTMIRMMRERGLPEPEFRVEGGHFHVVLRSLPPVHP